MKFMEERKLVIFMFQMQYFMHSVLKLIGIDEESKQVSAEEQSILATNNSVMTSYFYQKAYTSFMFRSYDGTKDNTEKYLACIGHTWANLFLHHAYHAFYVGLVSFWLARKSRDEQKWHEWGEKYKLALKKWAESSLWTFENKWLLLEAEQSFCNNDFEAAKTYYKKAVSSAKDHKVRREECMNFEHHELAFNTQSLLTHAACLFSLYTTKLWLASWQHTSIWRLEILRKPCITFCLHMKSIKSGEHLGNAIVCSSLLKVPLLQHLPMLLI